MNHFYGWGIVDKDGNTLEWITRNQPSADYMEFLDAWEPNKAPYRVVELFYKEEK